MKLLIGMGFAFISNFVHAAIIAFPLWWALNRFYPVSYWDALAITVGVWIIACAWRGVQTELKLGGER